MKTIQEQIAVMQHFDDGGKVEMQYADGTWKLNDAPQWEWCDIDYRIAEIDPYAELKKAAADQTKQIRCRHTDNWGVWKDNCSDWVWVLPVDCYEIRDKPKPMKKVKLLAWFDGCVLFWRTENFMYESYKRVPGKDMEIEVEYD